MNLVSLAVCLVLAVSLPRTLQADDSPVAVVSAFHEALVSTLRAGDYRARLAVATPAVTDHFQVSTIARISLGRYWQGLSEEERTGYQQLLGDLIASTYAARFSKDNGQAFAVTGTETITGDRLRVKSILTTTTETVSLDYQLQRSGSVWKIYDIVANGVSDLSLKRSTYSALFRDGGLEAVQQEIRRNIADNRTKDAS